ncbi:MAG: metallophosphoesterase family protein [SAR202 cluster bacterium]|nr:metallophosphoesterase family protein [SAR202 cluster bacterium]|tara:strand:+ start:662 stop:1399 length:738 start_codon:yes stop_codon:yes gene_type:complete
MRYLVVSDIHSNIVAFEAVLEDTRRHGGFDRILCLGDIIGYGPWPNECIGLLREIDHIAVAGNHDWAAINKISVNSFHSDAAAACLWNGSQLQTEHVSYLFNLPLTAIEGDFTLVHGSLRDPLWEYLLGPKSAKDNLDLLKTSFLLVGHSHLPMLFSEKTNGGDLTELSFQPGSSFEVDQKRTVLNPGSVGQPRDGDPRASYVLYDSELRIANLYRAEYSIDLVQHEMVRVGLPSRMSERLREGW